VAPQRNPKRPDFEEMRNQLCSLRDLFLEYLESREEQPSAKPDDRAETVAMIGVRERMRRTLVAIDDCLGTVEEISDAGGMAAYLRAHIPDVPRDAGKT
jgi:hypothetical protein